MPIKWRGQTEKCEVCGGDLYLYQNEHWYVDGKTIHGPWALMCASCFKKHGIGLGIGKGQKYDADTNEQIEE